MFDSVGQGQIALPLVGQAQQCERVFSRCVFQLLVHVCFVVDVQAQAVANGGGPKERQDHIGARRNAPKRHGLTEVLFVFVNLQFGGPINDAAQPQRGVDAHTHGTFSGRLEFQLRQAVEERHDIALIAEKIANAFADHRWQNLAINNSNRSEHHIIGYVVEGRDFSVQRLEGICWIWAFE